MRLRSDRVQLNGGVDRTPSRLKAEGQAAAAREEVQDTRLGACPDARDLPCNYAIT
jgi:hypothetical protein